MRSTGLNLLLLVLWLGLLAWGFKIYLTPPQVEDYLPTAAELNVSEPETASLQSFDSLRMPKLAQYRETVERPLFYPERRPPKEAPPPAPSPEPVVEEEEREMTLIGVLITPKSTTAMVKVVDEEKTDLLKVGDKVESWQLAEIKPDSILLKKGKETKELALLRNQRKPSMTPRSLRAPPPAAAESDQQADGQQQTGQEGQQPTQEQTQEAQQEDQVAADERLRLRQERLKAIAERRRQLLEQQRARAAERDTMRRNNN